MGSRFEKQGLTVKTVHEAPTPEADPCGTKSPPTCASWVGAPRQAGGQTGQHCSEETHPPVLRSDSTGFPRVLKLVIG